MRTYRLFFISIFWMMVIADAESFRLIKSDIFLLERELEVGVEFLKRNEVHYLKVRIKNSSDTEIKLTYYDLPWVKKDNFNIFFAKEMPHRFIHSDYHYNFGLPSGSDCILQPEEEIYKDIKLEHFHYKIDDILKNETIYVYWSMKVGGANPIGGFVVLKPDVQ